MQSTDEMEFLERWICSFSSFSFRSEDYGLLRVVDFVFVEDMLYSVLRYVSERCREVLGWSYLRLEILKATLDVEVHRC
jgi:hypothetical protein